MKPFNSCYVAGPMTGIYEFNFPMFDEVSEYLRKKLALKVISPAEIEREQGFDEKGKAGFEVCSDEQRHQFARNDIEALLKVDGVVLLPGWENSTGASNEAKIASWLGLHAFEARMRIFPLSLPAGETPQYDRAWSLTRIDLEHKWSSVHEEFDPIKAAEEYIKSLEDLGLSDEQRELFKGDPKPNTRAEVLRTAEELVNGNRNAQYGDPLQDFERTAAFWNAYLGVDKIKAHDVASMMALLKLSRIAWSGKKMDSWIDLAGYAACGAHCVVATTDPKEVIK